MPRIIDNSEHDLLPALHQSLEVAGDVDFCVGYFGIARIPQPDLD